MFSILRGSEGQQAICPSYFPDNYKKKKIGKIVKIVLLVIKTTLRFYLSPVRIAAIKK